MFVMGISVKLEAFEGPLDLLLHLIDKNKVNIYDIPIADITEQYMEYVRKMQEENLDIVSVDSKENGNVIYIKSAKVNVKINNVGTLLTVDCDINTAFTK